MVIHAHPALVLFLLRGDWRNSSWILQVHKPRSMVLQMRHRSVCAAIIPSREYGFLLPLQQGSYSNAGVGFIILCLLSAAIRK